MLTQRVVRLLLDGVDPAKILCLTFTKAAATTMATRVFDTLGKWTTLDDAALAAAIENIEGRRPDARRRLRARRLFAEALETPGGLKVQTIHAFCSGLLHQFPFEADVAAGFEVMEERAAAELIDRLRLDVLQEAADDRNSPLGRALTGAIVAAADVTFAEVVREAIAARDALTAWITRSGGLSQAIADLGHALGIGTHETLASIEAEFFSGETFSADTWPAAIAALAEGSSNDRAQSERLSKVQQITGAARIDAYLEIFCRADLKPRERLVTQALEKKHPQLVAVLAKEQARACALLERLRAVRLRERTAALVTIAHAVLSRYDAEKERGGLLDYDDLIEKTRALLTREGSATWVMYKLDFGIDHLLIDEAQDTSPKQWEVIERLTAEFTAGEGARANARRSIFAVGDEKQSIYSFQGAAPHRFDEMRRHFQSLHDASGMPFTQVRFLYSFRSAPEVLDAVDTVFRRPQASAGLTADAVETVHEAVRATAPGCVEVWPLVEPDARPAIEAWDVPFDTTTDQTPRVKLARRIAACVSDWIARGDIVAATGQRMSPGDILILVRQRGPLFEAIIRALKDANVEVAGADRLILTEHIAVMDLMSLADALLLREDDLALAEALKSPLFGLNEEQLFTLAHGRRGALRTALRRKAAHDPAFAAAGASLDALALSAQHDTPFTFFSRLLGPGGGRRRMLARLGHEAADALDEFLALALDYESRRTPSLQGFLGWLRTTPPEVKRDMDIARDEVRVMTVHGAKGLEAPVVILADTMTRPEGPRDPALLTLRERGPAPPLVWAGKRANDVASVAQEREAARSAAEAEHRRLLYVAMTRAKDRLIVCGARGAKEPPSGCWYRLVADALVADAEEIASDSGEGTIWSWRKSPAREAAHPPAPPASAGAAQQALPDWLARPAAKPAARRIIAVTPSAAGGERAAAPSPGALLAGAKAADGPPAGQRGRLLHRLLQALPEIAPEHRQAAADRFLTRARPAIDAAAAKALAAEALAIMDDPVFAALFAPGSRAETPIVGQIIGPSGAPIAVSGQIDRLAVEPDTVLIGDYKSDRVVPAGPQHVAPAYRLQLALYRAVLARIYPQRQIRAALVYTHTAQLVELAGELLDAELAAARLDPPGRHT